MATWRDEDASKGERFWYNTANHLTRVVYKANNVWTGNPGNWATFRDYHYAPDLLNWTSVNANGNLSSLANNSMNQFTSVNGFAPSYDGNFNQTTNHYGQTFVYNAANQAVGGSIQATYDGLGRCVRRTVGGVTMLFTYDNWNPILEWDQAGDWKAINVYGAKADEILARVDVVHGPMSYKRDRQGNITFVIGGSTQIIEKYTYDAFGRPTILSANNTQLPTSAYGNRFMFTGREWLAGINAYDYRHRLYDPDLGRFLQTDPLGLQTEGTKLTAGQKAPFSPGFQAPEAFSISELNLYRYCGDDPVDNSDPMGLLEFEIEGDAAFQQQIRSFIATIDSKPAGYAYLNELRESSFRQIIVPGSVNQTRALDGPNSMNGKGAGSRYEINPAQMDSGKDSTGNTQRPPFIGVAHETVGHGIENKRGQHVPKALDNSVDRIPKSEKAAVERENQVRKEHSIPERVDFYKKWKE